MGFDIDNLYIKPVEKFKTKVYYAILILILILIIMHMIDITSFCYQYNYNWDLGNTFKKICKNEYFEAETYRFKIADTRESIEITRGDEVKYIGIAMCVTIIITFILCIIFATMVWNMFAGQAYAYAADKTGWYKALLWIWLILCGLVCIVIACWVFLYIGLLFGGVRDISMFNTNENIYSVYIVILGIILFARFFYYCVNWLPLWFPGIQGLISNSFTLGTSNNWKGLIVFLAFLSVLLCVVYILGSLTRLFRNVTHWDTTQSESQFVKLFYTYNINLSGTRENIWTKFLIDALGLNNGLQEFEKHDVADKDHTTYKYVFIRKMSGIYATIFIIFIIMTLLCYVLQLPFFQYQVEDLDFFKYAILLPLVILLVVLFICSVITEFDNVINKYILSDPVIYYKTHISKANNEFNKIVNYEHKEIQSSRPGYICRNYGNAILNVLFSNIFFGIDALDRDDEYKKEKVGDEEEDKPINPIDITPEYIYENKCDNTRPFAFDDKKVNKEYSIDYYLNGKKFNKNIFYKFNRCTDINENVLMTVSKNIFAYKADKETFKTNLKTNILSAIKNVNNDIPKVYYDSNNEITILPKTSTGTEKLLAFTKNNKLHNTSITATENEIDKYGDFISEKIINEYDNMLTRFETIYKNIDSTMTPPTDITKFKILPRKKQYAKGLTKIIKTMFDNVNANMSKSTYELKYAQVTPYIISNYNNVVDVEKDDDGKVSNKIYQKMYFDVCQKPATNIGLQDVTALKTFIENVQKTYNKIKDKYDTLLLNNDTVAYESGMDEIKSIVTAFSTEYNGLKPKLTDLLAKKDANYKFIIKWDKTIVNGLSVDVKDIDNLDTKNVDNVILNTVASVKELVDFYITGYITVLGESNLEQLTLYKNRINENMKIIDNNLSILLSEVNAELNKNDSFNKPSCTDDKQIAQSMIDNAHDANTAIYLLLVMYIIAILSTNLIIL